MGRARRAEVDGRCSRSSSRTRRHQRSLRHHRTRRHRRPVQRRPAGSFGGLRLRRESQRTPSRRKRRSSLHRRSRRATPASVNRVKQGIFIRRSSAGVTRHCCALAARAGLATTDVTTVPARTTGPGIATQFDFTPVVSATVAVCISRPAGVAATPLLTGQVRVRDQRADVAARSTVFPVAFEVDALTVPVIGTEMLVPLHWQSMPVSDVEKHCCVGSHLLPHEPQLSEFGWVRSTSQPSSLVFWLQSAQKTLAS